MSVLWLFVCLVACVCVCLLRGHTFYQYLSSSLLLWVTMGLTLFLFSLLSAGVGYGSFYEVYAAYRKSIDMMGVIQGNVIIMSWLH